MLTSTDLEYDLRKAEKAFAEARREAHAAELVVYRTNPWKLAYDKALQTLDIARSNMDGCFAKIQMLRGDIDEALNLELHGSY